MAEVSMGAATQIYACTVAVEVEHRRVRHPQFRDFCFRVRHLLKALGETAADEYWKPIVSTLKRYRFEASVAPVGFGNRCLMPPETIYKIESQLSRCRHLFQPELEAQGTVLLEILKSLVITDDNPLLDELTGSVATGFPLTVALKEPRHVPVLEEVLADRGLSDAMTVVSEAQLRGEQCYEKIACIGAGTWYEDYVFRAPRAPHVIVVRFDWIRDRQTRGHVFEGWERVCMTLNIARRHEDNANDAVMHVVDTRDELIESQEFLPRLDLANIAQRYARPENTEDEAADDVVAKLFQLEGGRGVFLEADERATALVIDLEEDERRRVKRTRTAHITPGMFLLLREGGGGDYLVPIANKVLGERAAGLRKFQKRWKESLHSVVRQFGLPEIVNKLRVFGAVRANEVNVRNWMSERNIRTEDPRDFRAIMILIGLSKESEHCWQFASEIARAHQRAGAVVRKLLLRQVLRSDLTELERAGMMRFELSEVGGNPLAALRVLRIAPEVARISASHAGKLIDLEDAGWRA